MLLLTSYGGEVLLVSWKQKGILEKELTRYDLNNLLRAVVQCFSLYEVLSFLVWCFSI